MSTFASVTRNFTRAQIARQLPFAIASGLTQTAKDAQAEVIAELAGKFTLRSAWWKPGNKFGIKIKAAKKTQLVADIGTNADWLEKFETGADKRPSGAHLAIPTDNVRRNKRQIITKAQRPNALRGKRTFIAMTPSGPMLFQRKYRGRRATIVALYSLKTSAKIRKNSPIYEPAMKAINRKLERNFIDALERALQSAR